MPVCVFVQLSAQVTQLQSENSKLREIIRSYEEQQRRMAEEIETLKGEVAEYVWRDESFVYGKAGCNSKVGQACSVARVFYRTGRNHRAVSSCEDKSPQPV